MPFTLIHAFANYLAAVPIRKRVDIVALLFASVLPDLEGLYFTMGAYETCAAADFACLAEYPSHYLIHSFLGIFLIIAPLAVLLTFYFRKYMKLKIAKLKIVYFSALFGGLLHLILDVTVHKGADALYLLWPLEQQFSFIFEGAEILWNVLGALGIVAFVYFERKKLRLIR